MNKDKIKEELRDAASHLSLPTSIAMTAQGIASGNPAEAVAGIAGAVATILTSPDRFDQQYTGIENVTIDVDANPSREGR